MKKTNFYLSNILLDGFVQMIKEVEDNRSLDNKIIFIIPDKFALNAERIFFAHSKSRSTFNIEFMTLTRLANKVIQECNVRTTIIDKQVGSMMVCKIILNNKRFLKTFNKVYDKVGFIETVYNTINQFRSCLITPEELSSKVEDLQGSLKLKIQDFIVVYKEYLKLLQGNTVDAISRMKLFETLIKNSEFLKNVTINFAMFNNFTIQQVKVIEELLKHCPRVNFAMVYNNISNNKKIYINQVYQRVLEVCQNLNIEVNKKFVNQEREPVSQFLLDNLYAYSNKKFDIKHKMPFEIVEARNVEDEVEFVAKQIKRDLFNGLEPRDINVAVAGLKGYNNAINRYFNHLELPFYVEEDLSLSNHYSSKFLFGVLDIIAKNYSMNTIISQLKSSFVKINDRAKNEYENFVLKNNINYSNFFSDATRQRPDYLIEFDEILQEFLFPIKKLESELSEAKTAMDYTFAIKNYLTAVDFINILNQELIQMKDEGNLLEYKKLEQAIKKIDQVFTLLTDNLGEEEISLSFYLDMLKNVFETAKIKLLPLTANQIFVADLSTTTFYPTDKMYILGCNVANFPISQADCGIISDSEIEEINKTSRLEPSIQEINKREKFNCFQLLFNSRKVVLSYSVQGQGVPSEILEQIRTMFTINGKPFGYIKTSKQIEAIASSNNAKVKDDLLKTFIAKSGCVLKAQKYIDIEHVNLKIDANNYKKQYKKVTVKNIDKLALNGNKVSVSKIEKYMKCPFSFYMNYGLNLKPREKAELKPVDVGNILHYIGKEFVNEIKSHNKNSKELQLKVFETVINGKEAEAVKNKLDSFKIESLKQESFRFMNAIYHQIINGDFKVLKPEFAFKSVVQGLSFVGSADRVDIFDDYIRIIDYKTGKDSFSFKELYYGLKVQLFLYASIISKQLNKKVAGCFYLPVKNSFDKENGSEFSKYKLDGVLQKSLDVIHAMDRRLLNEGFKSDIISVGFTKTGEVNKIYKDKVIQETDFIKLLEYSESVFNTALNNILAGDMSCRPYIDTENRNTCICENCEFWSICRYDYNEFGVRKLNSSVNKEIFLCSDEE